ncbi:MAG: polyhydroxyalkanoate synthesis repressor PhaR [Gammaproteobacteria bacterium]
MTEQAPKPRIIKKYPNRRLYDTEKSSYVTLQEIRELVVDEILFVVIDKKTGDDITRSILLQIIFEQESESNPLFSNDNLERFIRYYGAGQHTGFSEFIGQGLTFFQDQQREIGKAVKGITGPNPLNFWNDLTQKNMDAWGQMMGLNDPEKPKDE